MTMYHFPSSKPHTHIIIIIIIIIIIFPEVRSVLVVQQF